MPRCTRTIGPAWQRRQRGRIGGVRGGERVGVRGREPAKLGLATWPPATAVAVGAAVMPGMPAIDCAGATAARFASRASFLALSAAARMNRPTTAMIATRTPSRTRRP